MANENFSASSYRQRKAKRRESTAPEWVTNPETGEKFCLRKVSAMAYAVAGAMPHNLTNYAVGQWKDEGLEIPDANGIVEVTPRQIEDGKRNVDMMAKVVQEASVIPKIFPGATGEEELDPADMDDSDLVFIFKYATGQMGIVNVRGGQAMNVADLKSVPKKPGRLPRTGTSG